MNAVNGDGSFRSHSRHSSSRMSATYPSQLGSQIGARFQWFFGESHRSNGCPPQALQPGPYLRRPTPSLEWDASEFARANSEQFEEFHLRRREREGTDRTWGSRSPSPPRHNDQRRRRERSPTTYSREKATHTLPQVPTRAGAILEAISPALRALIQTELD